MGTDKKWKYEGGLQQTGPVWSLAPHRPHCFNSSSGQVCFCQVPFPEKHLECLHLLCNGLCPPRDWFKVLSKLMLYQFSNWSAISWTDVVIWVLNTASWRKYSRNKNEIKASMASDSRRLTCLKQNTKKSHLFSGWLAISLDRDLTALANSTAL